MTDDIREELARILDESDPEMGGVVADEGHESWEWYLPQADAILSSPLLDRIKREAAAEALERFASEYQEARIRVSIANPNVGDYWAGAHDATGHAVDSLRSTAELLRKGHE